MIATQLEKWRGVGSSIGPMLHFNLDSKDTFIDVGKPKTVCGRMACQGTHSTLEAH
jgi:hypothetical protein